MTDLATRVFKELKEKEQEVVILLLAKNPEFVRFIQNNYDIRISPVRPQIDFEKPDANFTIEEEIKVSRKDYHLECSWINEVNCWGGHYETSCGNAFEFTEGDVKANGMVFCPYCGRLIVEETEVEAIEEEDSSLIVQVRCVGCDHLISIGTEEPRFCNMCGKRLRLTRIVKKVTR